MMIRRRGNTHRMKKLLLGTNFTNGLLGKIVIYAILIVLSFVFIFPLINMITVGLMSNLDLADHSIEWIPSEFYLENFRLTWRALRLPGSYFTTVLVAGVSTVCLMLSSALISYGLARFQVPGKFLIFSLLLFTYLAPKVLFFIPRYQLFTTLGLSGNMGALIFPALMGQGEQAALFILIFYQFFKMIPTALEEAAFLDGAGAFKTFYKIALPMVRPAFVIVGIYAFALYWNETLLTSFYLEGNIQTTPMLLNSLESQFNNVVNNTSNLGDPGVNPNLSYTEAVAYSGTILSIFPLIFFYVFVQKWFVESIDKSGITGE
ncbi:ABC transporter permease [Enterococcus casseliflavus]|uniref:ABC transporter, permease protein n=3 Tax=Enterococcus TaxID=1350 RepID=F0EP52_ENTCA|nr:carbohydrate ABC transporter permease [Enterococcus casseliflavus]EGC68077.1 ABC transporter, permease protein [Enterococcus casseliflavus ATCC 12755]OTO13337.1 hypothetical protein A5882_001741 [Enterococcus sp. 4E1_DIV0656]VTS25262.1 ABC transporter permease [Enterococcus casseliflavus]